MKNHIKVNGKLLQYNKVWSHLKAKQKEWISDLLRTKYIQMCKAKGKELNNEEKDEVLLFVMDKIDEREIWIPDYEVKKYFSSKINKWKKSV